MNAEVNRGGSAMTPFSLPMLMFAAVDISLSMMIVALRFQHNLLTGHRLSEPGWRVRGRALEKARAATVGDVDERQIPH